MEAERVASWSSPVNTPEPRRGSLELSLRWSASAEPGDFKTDFVRFQFEPDHPAALAELIHVADREGACPLEALEMRSTRFFSEH